MGTSEVGKAAEQLIAEHYVNNGYNILSMNYHSRYGEIDIILQQNITIVFCEVKFRKQNSLVSGVEAVDIHKQKRLAKTASLFLEENAPLQDLHMRFDIAVVTPLKKEYVVQIMENAFYIEEYWL